MRKPKNKIKMELLFDSVIAMETFRAGLIDGGIDQSSGFDSDKWGKNWVYLTAEYCNECSSVMVDNECIGGCGFEQKVEKLLADFSEWQRSK